MARAAAPVFWLQPQPADDGEEALRRTSELPSREARLQGYRAITDRAPGTRAAGLARLAEGVELIDAGRFAEAAIELGHPDLRQTAVMDRALTGLASAYEGMHDWTRAAGAYAELIAQYPGSPFVCGALFAAADALSADGRAGEAVPLLDRMLRDCPGWEPQTLLRLGSVQERRGDKRAAAAAYFRLEGDYPAAAEVKTASARLRVLRAWAPALGPAERAQRSLARARVLSEAGRHADARALAEPLIGRGLTPEQTSEARLIAARALLDKNRDRLAQRQLTAIPDTSAFAPEAAFLRARIAVRHGARPEAYETVVSRFPGNAWAEEALVTMAHLHDRDGRYDDALPYYRRLLESFPDGRYVERSVWALAWADYRGFRYGAAADRLETAARRTAYAAFQARCLYWAARAREAMGQADQARALYAETVRRFKHLYHGLRAAEALDFVRTGASSTDPAPTPAATAPAQVPEPSATRVRQFLLIGLLSEAAQELRTVPPAPQVYATLAWLDWQRGALRPAINTLKRAYPGWMGEEGDEMPEPVWRILYPIAYQELLVTSAAREGLDPALLAAIIWQESTFDTQAVSSAGARGLMQIVPSTGRNLARGLKLRYRPSALFDPETGLRLGARYFRRLLDAFGGSVERALAAYNAGPGRTTVWIGAHPEATAEEFIEGIPYVETRNYVMNILAHREQYRRLYGLPSSTPAVTGIASR